MRSTGRKKEAGVYLIRCLPTGHIYIGSTKDLEGRRMVHWRKLREGTGHNAVLQFAWDVFGEAQFKWEVLEYCPADQLKRYEEYWIEEYKDAPRFNILRDGRRPPEFSPEVRAKLSEQAKRQHAEGNLGRKTWRKG